MPERPSTNRASATRCSHVGIVGCSPPGAALCYEVIANGICGAGGTLQDKVQVSMHSHRLSDYMSYIEVNDWNAVGDLMLSSASKLASLGANVVVAPCNTIHVAFDYVAARSPIPWLHIADEVVAEAARRQYRRIALLGTRFIMESPIYLERFAAARIHCFVPSTSERISLNRYIFTEMVRGRFTVQAREFVTSIIARMREDGCEAVALSCTELPLLLSDTGVVPVLDSTRILAAAALRLISSAILGTIQSASENKA